MRWSEIDRNPSDRKLRQFALLWLLILAMVGIWQVGAANQRFGLSMVVIAIAGGIMGLLQPVTLKPVFVIGQMLAFPMGWLASYLLLALLFFALFTPLALVLRLLGRDALRLAPRRDAPSYWLESTGTANVRRYFRPY